MLQQLLGQEPEQKDGQAFEEAGLKVGGAVVERELLISLMMFISILRFSVLIDAQ